MPPDSEYLIGLSQAELEALADGLLAPSAQGRLDELLQREKQNRISPEERGELDRLLDRIDQLTLLKARARYTLYKRRTAADGT